MEDIQKIKMMKRYSIHLLSELEESINAQDYDYVLQYEYSPTSSKNDDIYSLWKDNKLIREGRLEQINSYLNIRGIKNVYLRTNK